MKPDILLQPFLLHVYQFPQAAIRAIAYLEALFRLVGFFNIVLGLLGLWILRRLSLSQETWILRTLIVSTGFGYLGPILFDNTVGSIGLFEIIEHLLFVLMLILGIFMWKGKWLNRDFGDSRSSEASRSGIVNLFIDLGATRLGVWTIKHITSPLQRWIYQATGGRYFTTIGSGRNVLLLTTKGRRTGKDRTTPVFYLHDGEDFVLCNVNPEHEHPNPWVLNLKADPLARLQVGAKNGMFRSREANPQEIERFWPKLVRIWPAYQAHYAKSGKRSIFIMTPIQDEANP